MSVQKERKSINVQSNPKTVQSAGLSVTSITMKTKGKLFLMNTGLCNPMSANEILFGRM